MDDIILQRGANIIDSKFRSDSLLGRGNLLTRGNGNWGRGGGSLESLSDGSERDGKGLDSREWCTVVEGVSSALYSTELQGLAHAVDVYLEVLSRLLGDAAAEIQLKLCNL